MEFPYLTCRRVAIAVAILGVGLAMVALGVALELKSPRTDVDDDVAVRALFVGTFLVGLGVSLPFARLSVALLVAFSSPGWAYAAFVVALCSYVILTR